MAGPRGGDPAANARRPNGVLGGVLARTTTHLATRRHPPLWPDLLVVGSHGGCGAPETEAARQVRSARSLADLRPASVRAFYRSALRRHHPARDLAARGAIGGKGFGRQGTARSRQPDYRQDGDRPTRTRSRRKPPHTRTQGQSRQDTWKDNRGRRSWLASRHRFAHTDPL